MTFSLGGKFLLYICPFRGHDIILVIVSNQLTIIYELIRGYRFMEEEEHIIKARRALGGKCQRVTC